MDPKLRVYFTQEMHAPALAAGASVIGHDFQFNDGGLNLVSGLLNDFFQTFIHVIDQYRATNLGTPDQMIIARIDDMPIALELRLGAFLAHMSYDNAIIYLMQAFSPHGL